MTNKRGLPVVPVHVRLPYDLHQRLVDEAKRRQRSLNNFVVYALTRMLDKEE